MKEKKKANACYYKDCQNPRLVDLIYFCSKEHQSLYKENYHHNSITSGTKKLKTIPEIQERIKEIIAEKRRAREVHTLFPESV